MEAPPTPPHNDDDDEEEDDAEDEEDLHLEMDDPADTACKNKVN